MASASEPAQDRREVDGARRSEIARLQNHRSTQGIGIDRSEAAGRIRSGIEAVIVYPMNALASSQGGEFRWDGGRTGSACAPRTSHPGSRDLQRLDSLRCGRLGRRASSTCSAAPALVGSVENPKAAGQSAAVKGAGTDVDRFGDAFTSFWGRA